MARRSRWVAALAAGGTSLGVGIAIADMPRSTAAVPVAKVVASTTTTATTVPSDRVQLASTVAEVNRLEARIAGLRSRLAAVSAAAAAAPSAAPAPGVVVRTVVRTLVVGSSTSAADQARINAEQAQLVSEQAGLTAERNALAAGDAQLRTAQSALVAAQARLAATPTTHTTTGASKGNGGGDN